MNSKLCIVACLTLTAAVPIGQAQNLSLQVVGSSYGPPPDRNPQIQVSLTDQIGGRQAELQVWDENNRSACDRTETAVTSTVASIETLEVCDYSTWYQIEVVVLDPALETAGPVHAQSLANPPDEDQQTTDGPGGRRDSLTLVTYHVVQNRAVFRLHHATPRTSDLRYRTVEMGRDGIEIPGSRRPSGDDWDDLSRWIPVRWSGNSAVGSVRVDSGDLLLVEAVEVVGGDIRDGLAFQIRLRPTQQGEGSALGQTDQADEAVSEPSVSDGRPMLPRGPHIDLN